MNAPPPPGAPSIVQCDWVVRSAVAMTQLIALRVVREGKAFSVQFFFPIHGP